MTDNLAIKAVDALAYNLETPPTPGASRKKRSLGISSNFWTPGQTLGISFTGAPRRTLKRAIVNVAREWLKYANLDFKLLSDNDATADIRIRTDVPEDFNESVLGTASLRREGPSMTLGVKPSDPSFTSTVLHEFGHALGMHHEHQHPDANIQWDEEALVKEVTSYFSDEEQASEDFDALLQAVIQANYGPVVRDDLFKLPYDTASIMHYSIPPELTLNNWVLEENHRLSEKDKQFMRLVYPGRDITQAI